MAKAIKKRGRGQPPHEPTEEKRLRVQIERMKGTLIPRISFLMGIDDKTLRKYYRKELDAGNDEIESRIAGKVYAAAMTCDTIPKNLPAAFFLLKTQFGWREVQPDIAEEAEVVVFEMPNSGRADASGLTRKPKDATEAEVLKPKPASKAKPPAKPATAKATAPATPPRPQPPIKQPIKPPDVPKGETAITGGAKPPQRAVKKSRIE